MWFLVCTCNQIRIVKLNKVLMGARAICISLSYETCFFTSFKRYSIKIQNNTKKKTNKKKKNKRGKEKKEFSRLNRTIVIIRPLIGRKK